MATLGTVITRFLPFVLFPDNRTSHPYLTYLGKVLPYSVIGLLVVYCLNEVTVIAPSSWLPETIAIVSIIALHSWKRNVLLSIGAGTAVYMLFVQIVFT